MRKISVSIFFLVMCWAGHSSSAHAAQNVCDYVADAYNKGTPRKISIPVGRIMSADGKAFNIVVNTMGSSCESDSEIKVEGFQNRPHDQSFGVGPSEEMLKSFHLNREIFRQDDCSHDDKMLISFHRKTYIVTIFNQKPDSVIDPNVGVVCHFSDSYKPKLVENRLPQICEKLSHHKLQPNVEWTPLKKGEVHGYPNTAFPAIAFDEVTKVSFNGKKTFRIGHFIDEQGPRSDGCSKDGVAILEKNAMEPVTQEPNKSLQDLLDEIPGCREADADLVKIGDTTYVKAWGGFEAGQPVSLLRYNDKGSFETVCRIEQKLTVTPSVVPASQRKLSH